MSKFFNNLFKYLRSDNGSGDGGDAGQGPFAGNGNGFDALLNFDNFPAPPGINIRVRGSGGGGGGGSGRSSTPTTTFTTSGSSGFEWSGIPFSATSSEGYIFPPDNAMAVSPANSSGNQTVVSSENGLVRIDVVNVATGSVVSTVQSLWNTLFGAPINSNFFYSDPRSFYDAAAGRFVVAVDEIDPNSAQSYVVYAVSNSANPTSFKSGWTVHSFSTTSGTTWSDQPLAAVNGNLYVTTNQYTAGASGTYQYDDMAIVPNYASSSSAIHITAFSGPSAQAATVEDGSSTTQYFVSHDGTNLDITAFNGTAETSSFQISGMPQLALDSEFTESQKGTSYPLDAGDGRVTSAVYDAKNNLLYALFETTGTSSAPTDELVQINLSTKQVTDTLQLNDLLAYSPAPSTGSTIGAGTFNGSLAVDAQGDILVNYSVSGPNMDPADYYAAWKGTGGAAPTPTADNAATIFDYRDSVAAYVDPNNDPIGRWGDYSTAIPNPSASNGFFISNEYDNGYVNYLAFFQLGSWGTVSASVNLT